VTLNFDLCRPWSSNLTYIVSSRIILSDIYVKGRSVKKLLPELSARARFNRIRQVAPMCIPSNTWFFWPIRLSIPNGISIGSAVFAQLAADDPYTSLAVPFAPSKLPRSMGDLDDRLMHASLGPPESTSRTARRYCRQIALTTTKIVDNITWRKQSGHMQKHNTQNQIISYL